MNTRSLLLLAALFAAGACQMVETDFQPIDPADGGRTTEKREVVITATMDEADPQTRTSRASDGSILWSPGDAIKLFSAGETAKFVSQNTEPAAQAQFKGSISFVSGAGEDGSVNYTWALYPYREDAYYDAGKDAVVTTLPYYQKSKAKTFSDETAISLGKSTSMAFSFKNAYSGLRLRFYRSDIISVTVSGMNNESLAGKVAIGLDPTPVIKSKVMPVNNITMIPEEGAFLPTTSGNDNDYYVITLPDIDLQRGVAITIFRRDGYQGTYYHSTAKLERNRFKNLTEPVDTRIENPENISNGKSTGWVKSQALPPNEIWYESLDDVQIDYSTVYSNTGNVLLENIPPTSSSYGILRFEAPLTETDPYCFGPDGNEDIMGVMLPSSVEKINAHTFEYCPQLSRVSMPGVKTICTRAFYYCPVGWRSGGTLELPQNLETLEGGAFDNCNYIYSVTIPKTVSSIGEHYCGVQRNPFINCPKIRSFSGKYATADGLALVDGDKLLSFASGNMTGKTYAVPGNVRQIMQCAFSEATIEGVALPEGLETIYDWGFSNCHNLKNVTIPASVKDIYYAAFRYCYSMEWIKILNSAELIEAKSTDDAGYDVEGLDIFTETNDCPIFVPGKTLNWYSYGQYWDAYGSKLGIREGRFQAGQESNQIWYTVVEGTSENEAYNVADWSSFDYGFQVWYDEDKGFWIAESSGPISWIPDNAFRGCTFLKSVFLPDTGNLPEIGEQAFAFCSNLETVVFGSEKYEFIYDNAFESCNLKSIVVPNTNGLGSHVFSRNHNLTSVVLSESIDDWPETNTNPFAYCENIIGFSGDNDMIAADGKCLIRDGKLVSYATASTTGTFTVPENVTRIGSHAFTGAKFQAVVLPEGLTEIGWYSFGECPNLLSLDIPASVNYIDGRFVSSCPALQYIRIDSSTPPGISEVTIDENVPSDTRIQIPGIAKDQFADPSNTYWYALKDRFAYYQTPNEIWCHLDGSSTQYEQLQGSGYGSTFDKVIVLEGNGTTLKTFAPILDEDRYNDYIDDSILTGMNTWISYVFKGDITTIPDNAFSSDGWSTKLDCMSPPKTVSTVGNGAFQGCSKLKYLPVYDGSLVTIGADAFNGCTSMKFIAEDSDVNSAGLWTFHRLTSIGARAFKNCSSLNWPMMVTNSMTIGDSAFEGSSLRGFVFNGVTDLGKSAFKNCKHLDKYGSYCNIGGRMTEIKDSTFYGCNTLVELRIAGGSPITKIGNRAFSGCTRLEHVREYSSSSGVDLSRVTTIGNYAFWSCYAIVNVNLPAITSMGQMGFGQTNSLSTMHFGPGLTTFPRQLLYNTPTNAEITLYFEGTTPPTFKAEAFRLINTNVTDIVSIKEIHVPVGCKTAYQTALTNSSELYSVYTVIDDL